MSQTVLIGGGSGLIGSRLAHLLIQKGYTVYILSRKRLKSSGSIKYFKWDLNQMEIDKEATNVDHIINLTGAGIADARWTDKRKNVLTKSRVNSSKLLYKNLMETGHKPKSFISASAVGYYGDRGNEELSESSTSGKNGFMVDCCVAWEESAQELVSSVDRLVIIRVGIVLSKNGGALPKILMTRPMLSYFGDGKHYYPWIHIDDVCEIFISSIENKSRQGVYNATALTSLTNKEFTKKIKAAVGGFIVPAPAFALRMAMGEMANVVLNSNNVVPQRLIDEDYAWKFTDLTEAVKDIMKRKV